ncbi:hypothetical protein [Streptomyces odontomachi]|uniref:hypothetical protein n=1 Tax=Streptomyces odontomachi TaxID=2944940 RepID=UPI00210BDB4F|nr:hypothetical protein [Streptomyces sp. ODS25]
MSDVYSPLSELNSLKELEDRLAGQCFAPGFELFDYNDDERDWFCGMADEAYLEQVIYFAYAASSGSYYGLWRCDDRADLATLPVVCFGDEGELHVAARGLRELFRLLAVEPADPDDHCPGREEYLTWLAGTFGLTAPEHAEEITGPAEDEYGQRFAEWVRHATHGAVDLTVTQPGLG